jgi:regulator of replication initiation timing
MTADPRDSKIVHLAKKNRNLNLENAKLKEKAAAAAATATKQAAEVIACVLDRFGYDKFANML